MGFGSDAYATTFFFASFITLAAVLYVLSGQHIFSAAMRVATLKQKEHLAVPKCVSFNYGNGKMEKYERIVCLFQMGIGVPVPGD